MDWHTCAERLSELKMQTYTIVAGKIALPCNNQQAHPTCTCGPSHYRRTSRWRASAPARALLARLRRLRDAPWLQPSVLAGNAVDCQKLRDRARASARELAGAQHSVRAGTLAPAPSRSPGRARTLAAGPAAAGGGRRAAGPMAGVARAVRAPCTARVAGTRVAGAEKSASKLAPGSASGTAAAPLRHSAPPTALLKTHARRAGEAPEVSAGGRAGVPLHKARSIRCSRQVSDAIARSPGPY